MDPEEIAKAIAERANSCCHRSDGFKEDVERFALELIDQAVRAAAEGAARIAVALERERCAKVAEGGSFLHDDAPTARFGREVAAAIRRG